MAAAREDMKTYDAQGVSRDPLAGGVTPGSALTSSSSPAHGYAASRMGKAGSMFGSDQPQATHGFEKPEDMRAAGTSDFAHAFAHGDSKLSAYDQAVMRSDVRSKNVSPVMLSDDRTKLASAWDEGYAAAAKDAGGLAGQGGAKLKAMSGKSPLADAIRRAKETAYDEGRTGASSTSRPMKPDEKQQAERVLNGPQPRVEEPARDRGEISLPKQDPWHESNSKDPLKRRVADAYLRTLENVSPLWRAGTAIGGMLSDERTKEGVIGLDDPNLRISDKGRGYIAKDEKPEQDRWKAMADRESARAKAAPPKAHAGSGGQRKMSDAEMMKWGQSMLGNVATQRAAAEHNGPSVRSDERSKNTQGKAGSMASANRAMAPSMYEYKPEFAKAEGQAPGEKNVGPMAQNMAKDPIASVAISKTPEGLLAINKDKGLKLVMGGLADVQRQLDEMKRKKRKAGS
jgi:hypothetical protein